MNALQASVLAFALAFAGMVALAFAMERHHEQLTGAMEISRARSRLLRCAGALLLAVAVILACARMPRRRAKLSA